MRVKFEVVADVANASDAVDDAGKGVDLTPDEIDELAEEIERILISYFRKHPWATYEHNSLSLFGLEVSSSGEKP